jgi:hypothetical protein
LCVYVCVRERQRQIQREGEGERERERALSSSALCHMYVDLFFLSVALPMTTFHTWWERLKFFKFLSELKHSIIPLYHLSY